MNTRPVRVAVIGVVAGLLLGGCGADGASPDAGSSGADAASPSPGGRANGTAPTEERTKDGAEKHKGRSADQPDGAEDGAAQPSPSATPSSGTEDGTDDGSARDGSAPALEMPEAPEPTVSSLSELLPPTNPAPLVTTPLPRAASAEGRLLRQVPDVVRPTRATQVRSSSVSPSGDRLQVGVVATTSLSPDQVLLAYRARLTHRGLVETATPPSVAGSRAAAFRRGDSVVTVTVTPRGSGATYAVHASLRAERG